MHVGPFTITFGIEFQVWEGRTLKYRADSLLEALDWAEAEDEADMRREEIAQYGDGSRAKPERRGMLARSA